MIDSRWLVRPVPRPGARVRLFFLPFAGGGASVFRTWHRDLPESVEGCALELPGRGARIRELPSLRLEPLVQGLADTLEPLLDRPFALFGHSMGGLISFELVRELRRRHAPLPCHLFISAFAAPQHSRWSPQVHLMSNEEFLQFLVRLEGTPPEVLASPGLMDMLMPIIRADWAVIESYTYRREAPLPVPLTVLGGEDDKAVARVALEEWAEQTRESFTLEMFPGGHFFPRTSAEPLLQLFRRVLRPWTGS
ncbi:thioesterase [Corallococcus sp. AB030]|uniref:thioesterase II family protein n=1 Tax=Corallococcus TaxID=83461 RepID=UPI000EDCBDBD|nr:MULTISPECIES: alpha/beta fold hydrolase [unclassified Corallococcus]RKI20294.1 thioesterase [Corallococcus sp. AB030]RUO95225.1 thioesterase [Corallococcus sp. AB018]